MSTTESSAPSQVNKKTYPVDEEDVTYEKEIVDAIKKLDLDTRFQFIAVNNVVLQKKQLDTDLDSDMKNILNTFNKLQEPMTKASDEIISGKRALNQEETESIKAHLSAEDFAKLDANNQEPIPDYWSTALLNCAPLADQVQENDKPILKHLTQIVHKPEDDTENFTITFHFSPNDHFENQTLSIKFFMISEGEAEKTESDEIKWKEGKNITKKTVTKKQKNKKTGKTREIKKEVDAESFFNFFKSINIDDQDEDADEEEANQLLEQLDVNLQMAQDLENELLPYHLEYFLGIREPEEDDDEGYGDLDDEDDDDEDDDEDDKPAHGKKK